MTRYAKRFWVLGVALSGLAGAIDAIGFLKLDGLYVSFMSGNSTRLAVGLVKNKAVSLTAGRLLAGFVVGVVAGTVLATAAGSQRKPVVLALVGTLLALAASMDGRGDAVWTTTAMTVAMGAANMVFQRDGEVSIGVTYMTGTLVKFGQRLADALTGGARWGWVPYLALWLGLVGGAVAGARCYPRFGASCLWAAALFAIGLSFYAAALGPAERR